MGWAFDRISTLEKIGRIQRAPDPTPDFQMEVEKDIKSETSGILRDLLLALAKVRGTGLQGRELYCQGRGWGGVGSIAIV